MNSFYIPESAMAIVAHPDDIEFSCSGTLARWAHAGARISYVLCTSGDVGIDEPGMTRQRAAEIREAEQRAAAECCRVRRRLEPVGRADAPGSKPAVILSAVEGSPLSAGRRPFAAPVPSRSWRR